MNQKISVFWFRRDLRLEDNKGLYEALNSGYPVLPIFIFDSEILQDLSRNDPRISFIHQCLDKMRLMLHKKFGRSLAIYLGRVEDVFAELLHTYSVQRIYTNKDYEPYAQKRDSIVAEMARTHSVEFHSTKDQVVFEEDEIVKDNGDPYLVFTPYKNKWKSKFDIKTNLKYYQSWDYCDKIIDSKALPWLTVEDIGCQPSLITVPPFNLDDILIENYQATRNYPSDKNGTSRIGPYLRFGTVSIREVIQKAIKQKNDTFWNELIWREFFMQILWHFPQTIQNSFKPQYDRIMWRNDQVEFQAWKSGKTGYPMVDAGIRQLNATGYMHNRVRMLVASFLCKHLLIDWRWGEAYFAQKLLDYELSSNVGNWQWAAGCGVDAAPYFRIFNPYTQAEKFDPDDRYIKQWVPEYKDSDYPPPIVDHFFARNRCIIAYKAALNS
ncbi:MAG: cryptochrome/photolyase family protein [Flavobacteriaceae bacterium]